jgi:hypothetical protein
MGKNTLVALKLINFGVEKHELTVRSSLSVNDARCQLEEVDSTKDSCENHQYRRTGVGYGGLKSCFLQMVIG